LPEIVYVTLRYVFLAMLYIFVLVVAWVIYREMMPPRPAEAVAPPPRKASTRRKAGLLISDASGRKKIQSWELQGEMVIGRGGECAVSLKDEFASNVHAKLYQVEGRYYIEDLGSTNGTYVNGRRINYPTELRGGDFIKIGRTVMEFRR
jgi:FHA domain